MISDNSLLKRQAAFYFIILQTNLYIICELEFIVCNNYSLYQKSRSVCIITINRQRKDAR